MPIKKPDFHAKKQIHALNRSVRLIHRVADTSTKHAPSLAITELWPASGCYGCHRRRPGPMARSRLTSLSYYTRFRPRLARECCPSHMLGRESTKEKEFQKTDGRAEGDLRRTHFRHLFHAEQGYRDWRELQHRQLRYVQKRKV